MPASEDFYLHHFVAIDNGNEAQHHVNARVRELIDLARQFSQANYARVSAVRGQNDTFFDIPNRAYLHEVEMCGKSRTIAVTLEVTFRGEPDYLHLQMPYAWLWSSDAEINAALAEMLTTAEARRAVARAAQEREQEKRDREEFERLRDRFGGSQNT